MNIRSWAEIQTDFAEYWYIYLSMPVIAAIIGYVTKIVALEMMYKPMEFRGIGPIGWQGVVPRRSGKIAATAIELLTERLLKPEEILDRVDSRQVVSVLRVPLEKAVDEIARELIDEFRPGLWDSMPGPARRALLMRVRTSTPEVVDKVLGEIRADMSQFFDLHLLSVSTLVRNKAKLNNLMKATAASPMAFMRRSGIYFGLAIGMVQMVAWGALHSLWIMPVFGLITGLVSDYVALNMLFAPRYPRRFLGLRLHGVIHARREEISREYAKIVASELFAPDVLFDAILTGPGSDRLFAMIQREVMKAIDAETGRAAPLVRLAIGTQRYRDLKQTIATRVVEMLPATMDEAKEYTVRTMDIENTLVEKMSQMTAEEFEALMRPVFKDDEWLMITVGGALGFLVGESQVEMVVHFTGG